MPSGSTSDKSQQSSNAGFPSANNLYPNKNIWNTPFTNAHTRGPSIGGSKGASTASPASGRGVLIHRTENADAGAVHASADADVWGTGLWNNDESSRSVSSSPNRTRDATLSKGMGFGAGADSHATVAGLKNGFSNGSLYSHPFPSQKRTSSQETSYFDSINSFSQPRDQSVPPSRQSQGSPAYSELYNGRGPGHAHSNSIQSQRGVPSHSLPFSNQAANNRAFNMNKQMDEEMSLAFGRRLTVDHSSTGATAFDPASQPFQLNPGSQAFGESAGPRFPNGVDTADPLVGQFNSLKRHSVDRASPVSSYRLETGNSPRTYAPTDVWNNRSSTRDPRTSEIERRAAAQPLTPSFPASYYPSQYPYANLPPQFPPNYLDPYTQNYRHPMVPGYGMPQVPSNYALAGNLPPIRPAADHDPARSLRSPLLDEFRSSNKSSKRYELKDIYGFIVEFSGDQHGSRFIQQKLETANSDEKDQVFREIETNAIQLMKDVFGNYVVQKFFEHGSQVQKRILAEKMKGKMIDLSVQVYACRVVQKVCCQPASRTPVSNTQRRPWSMCSSSSRQSSQRNSRPISSESSRTRMGTMLCRKSSSWCHDSTLTLS